MFKVFCKTSLFWHHMLAYQTNGYIGIQYSTFLKTQIEPILISTWVVTLIYISRDYSKISSWTLKPNYGIPKLRTYITFFVYTVFSFVYKKVLKMSTKMKEIEVN